MRERDRRWEVGEKRIEIAGVIDRDRVGVWVRDRVGDSETIRERGLETVR